jgi:phosphate:Na+ symporter
MKDAFAGLQESQAVVDYLGSLGGKPLLALLAGIILTLLLQSSSASIAIVQLLAINGAFGSDWVNALNVAVPFVLGCNVGTTITAQIAAFRTNLGARRTAWAHTMFNVVGAGIVLPFVYWGWFGHLVLFVCPWELGPKSIALTIAVAHTVFNIANSVVFLPLAGVLETLVIWLIPEKAGDAEARPVVLEEHLLDTPVIALEQARREILRMTEKAKKAFHGAVVGLLSVDRKLLAKVAQTEDTIDEFQSEITSYLVALSKRQLSDEVSIELPVLLHTVNDLERVGDHAVNIVEVAQRKIEQGIRFSDSARNEGEKLKAEIDQMFECISAALRENDTDAARRALANEENLNRMQIDFRRSHVQRMTDGKCSPQAGLMFIDLVDNIEKVGDHLTNIAQAVMGGLQWDGFEAKGTEEGLMGAAEQPV